MHPRAFWGCRYGGVTRYVCELTECLIKENISVSIPISNTPNEYFRHSSFYDNFSKAVKRAPFYIRILKKIMSFLGFRNKASRLELYYQALSYCQKANYDLVHPTDTYSTEILPYIKSKPLVVTIHDMIDEVYYVDRRPGHKITSARKRQFAERADKIIAISENTKKDIVFFFGINPEKIKVIYHGNSLRLPHDHFNIRLPVPENYILFVGTRRDYKNFSTMAKAFSIIAKKFSTIHLVCAGGGLFTDEEEDFLRELNILDRCLQLSPGDKELATMYNRSLCFVFPSMYEGFGLPILEAFECGAPVVCAKASCFPEIAKDAALYFQPEDYEELAAILSCLISNPDEREKLRNLGKVRLKDFSWQKAALQTLEVYRDAMLQKKSE